MAVEYLRLCDLEEGERFVLVRTGRKYTKGPQKPRRREFICEPDQRTAFYEGHLNWACRVKRIQRVVHD